VDTPAKLKAYAASKGLERDGWHWLVGSPLQTRQLAALLGVQYRDLGDGTFAHSNVVTVLDREGVPVARLEGLGADLEPAVGALLGAIPPQPSSLAAALARPPLASGAARAAAASPPARPMTIATRMSRSARRSSSRASSTFRPVARATIPAARSTSLAFSGRIPTMRLSYEPPRRTITAVERAFRAA